MQECLFCFILFAVLMKGTHTMEVFRPGCQELTKKAVDAAKIKPGGKALDIGCGFGASLVFLKEQYGLDVYGIDSAPPAVEKAAKLIGGDKAFCADACALPFENESFELVLLECVLTLISEPEQALQEALRVLKPGGALIISGLCGTQSERISYCGLINTARLTAYLEAQGLEMVLVSDETQSLRRFVAEIIFEYDSIENYIAAADRELGGSVLNCNVPVKGTGYVLISARKKAKV